METKTLTWRTDEAGRQDRERSKRRRHASLARENKKEWAGLAGLEKRKEKGKKKKEKKGWAKGKEIQPERKNPDFK